MPALAQTGGNVLIVANTNSPVSEQIAQYYAQKRQVPADHIVRVTAPATDEILRETFESQIERPIAQWLAKNSAQDRILYLVLTKGVPLRVSGTSGTEGTVASVDSELTLLYRKLIGWPVPLAGAGNNPYFLSTSQITDAKPFSHQDYDLYLVTRLDGYTLDDVKQLIDRGVAPQTGGRVLLDSRGELRRSPGNEWLEKAAAALKALPGLEDRVVYDTNALPLRKQTEVLGYYSWGSNDTLIFWRDLDLEFVPGALAAMFVSTDARTMSEPPAQWQIRGGDYAGSSQSLAADLVRQGITGVAGHVAEPFLSAAIRPEILFPAYLQGFNLAESFYLAMPTISWQTVIIGDPLAAPFRKAAVPAQQTDAALDPETELPVLFSQRKIALMSKAGIRSEAAKLALKSEIRFLNADVVGGRQALEKATEIDDRFVAAHLRLAALYAADEYWTKANDRYRQVLNVSPDHPVALNNLSYSLAEHENKANEALPIALKAYERTKGAPAVADTLAWVYHKLHRDTDAEPLARAATKALPANADVHVHAAFIYAALGKTEAAAEALSVALKLDGHLAQKEDVRELRRRLGTP